MQLSTAFIYAASVIAAEKENLMTRTADDTRIPLAGCSAVETNTGAERDLGALDGETVLVLLRHRH